MNSIYTAIMKAADHIERNPHLYHFQSNTVPDCGTPGCMLGWIGHFLNMQGANVFHAVAPQLGLKPPAGSSLLLVGTHMGRRIGETCENPTDAVNILRRYAARFKPIEAGIPASVREIFTHPRQTISDTAVDQRFA